VGSGEELANVCVTLESALHDQSDRNARFFGLPDGDPHFGNEIAVARGRVRFLEVESAGTGRFHQLAPDDPAGLIEMTSLGICADDCARESEGTVV
jgi:hypothetical protein